MKNCLVFALLVLYLSGCGKRPEPISIQVFPAVLASDAKESESAGWDSVSFEGNQRCAAGTYLVAPEPL